MSFGYCYDAPTKCRGSCQPGVVNFRAGLKEVLPQFGSYGCLNCRSTRTGSTLSLHGEGRAEDVSTPIVNGVYHIPSNTKLGDCLVAAAEELGVQRVIGWGPRYDGSIGPREWDSRLGERYWEPYSGPLHRDHNHVEFCWESALHLTKAQVVAALRKHWFKEDELTPEEKQKQEDTYNAVFVFRTPEGATKPKRYEHLNIIEQQNRAICAKLGIELDEVGLPKN